MDPELARQVALYLLTATGGAVVLKLFEWFLGRGDRRQSREDAQAKANDELAIQLRKEMREDNEKLRERLRKAEDNVATVSGQMIELNKTNSDLRQENLNLTQQNGSQMYQLSVQKSQIEAQAGELQAVKHELQGARDRISILEAAMKEAKIPVPVPTRRTGDTGPLGPSSSGGGMSEVSEA